MKTNETSTLITPYEANMSRDLPLSDYPRPTMVRDSYISLNGEWDFAVTTDADADFDYTEKILVPYPPESRLSGYNRAIPRDGVMHYRRSFTLDDGFIRDRVLLHIDAADCISDVYVNGNHAAHNEGGYLPFSADITDFLEDGENELCIDVSDSLSPIYPYGKQKEKRGGMWYTPTSGIWQSVWLESVPEGYIHSLKITQCMKYAEIEVVGIDKPKTLTLDDGSVYNFSDDTVRVIPKEIRLWSPEDPHLYNFTLKCGEDEVKGYFALREIGTRTVNGKKRLTLNGKPYLFNGLLDQGYFPDGLFLPATYDGFRDDILYAKALGFNTLRKHIKIEPEIFYHLCDKLGMVVFQDMVNNSTYSFLRDTALPTIGMKRFPDSILHRSKRSRAIFEEHMLKTIERLYNFPSVLYYTIFNEGWGQFSADEMYEVAKRADPTRIYDSTSGWFWQRLSDVDSHHVYFKPIRLKDKRSEKPIVISEFGGYSLRISGHLFGDDNYGYKLFKTKEELQEAFIRLYDKEVRLAIQRGATAFIYTQVSDIEDETNGVLTYDRQIKKLDPEKVAPLMKELSEII
ncbi:MAG: glycoside hydrolase family 2 [Clostridia bacterium]|nr:glycoside hydrolase family 2 [Clostridia bacterium]